MEVEVEAPAGERRVYSEAGYYAQAVYTPEQQARLGIDEHGGPAPRGLSARQPAATPASNKRLLSPASSQKSGSSLVVRDTSPYELPDEPQA